MTQLILNGDPLPETSNDKYTAELKEIGTNKRMISTRMVKEVSGNIWVIKYSYDYLADPALRKLLETLRGGEITVDFMTPEQDAPRSGTFLCTTFPAPAYAFSRSGKAFWHNVAFVLEEVKGS